MGRIAQSLLDAVRRMAYTTSVESLKRKGIDKVNVLGIDRMAFLIQEAVKRSLRYKMLALDRAEVATATKEEFLNLLQNSDHVQAHDDMRRMKDEAESQVDELRRRLTSQKSILEKQLATATDEARPDYSEEDAQIREQIALALSDLDELDPEGMAQVLEDRFATLVLNIVSDERAAAHQARAAAKDREVEMLERRIRKLNESLAESEHQLKEMAQLKTLDDGISSIYREVQGLSDADDKFERKRGLMADIFEANLELQKGGKAV